jgi:DNA-binding MltR family transcriptional regulator
VDFTFLEHLTSPLDHPEAQELFSDLLISLTAESDRGAILVGTAHVDNTFASLLEAVFPAALSKKDRKRLLKYPGPLSSLAARADVAYALRLIPRTAYDATNALRAIRNELAHGPDAFDLAEQYDRIRTIYAAMGETLPGGLRQLAIEMMLEYKSKVAMDAVKELNQEYPEAKLDIDDKAKVLKYISDKPDLIKALDAQVPRWELAIGIALLCGMIIMFRERASKVLGSQTLIGSLRSAGDPGE